MDISYTTEISKLYCAEIAKCKSHAELKEIIFHWKAIAYDAFEAIWDAGFDWDEFEIGRKSEAKGKYAGDSWARKYASILLPEIIMFVGLQAQRFHAPEGMVFLRLLEMKGIKRLHNGVYKLDVPRYTQSSITNGE